jgi:hypothetical protein
LFSVPSACFSSTLISVPSSLLIHTTTLNCPILAATHTIRRRSL